MVPPLIVSEEECDKAVEIIEEAVKSIIINIEDKGVTRMIVRPFFFLVSGSDETVMKCCSLSCKSEKSFR